MSIRNVMSIDEAIEILSDYCCTGSQEGGTTDATFGSQIYKVEDALELARIALHEMNRGYAERVRIFDDPYTGRLYTTCSFCQNRVSKRDRYCKHCGRIFMEDNP